MTGQARYVGATGRGDRGFRWVHAVWVPQDLPEPPSVTLPVLDGHPLHMHASWTGVALCGMWLPRVVAGPQGGHDLDRFPSADVCPRCKKAMADRG